MDRRNRIPVVTKALQGTGRPFPDANATPQSTIPLGSTEPAIPPIVNCRFAIYNAVMLPIALVIAALLVPASQAPKPQAPAQPQPQAPLTPAPGNPVAVISTTMGDVTVELFKDRAPVSVANFLQYVADGFYSGTIFHRVERGFVVQGGGYTPELVRKSTRPPVQNEATNGLRNTRGTLAMARTLELRSATSEFYFNVANNAVLDHRGYTPREFGYAVFGRVLSGMDVVDRMAGVEVRRAGDHDTVPVEPIVIKSITVKSGM
jgi:cyclophilin family peptidyl-prolyl cis-trans isomerase